MGNETNNSLINVGDISKPANTLIEKVSEAVGGIFKPYQIKRTAKAEAEAALIKAQGEIQVTELQRRAMQRFVEEECRKQQNIEDITAQAIPFLKEKTDAHGMENDWVTNFFDKSRIVSDRDMQGIWARVLAGEANEPGTYSKRTVNYLGDLDRADAELFTRLCGFGWTLGDFVPLIFDVRGSIYLERGITFSNLQHLESIGLIQFQSLTDFRWLSLPKNIEVSYYGSPLVLVMPQDGENQLEIGRVLLTKVGAELAPICGGKPVDGFFDYVRDRWSAYILRPPKEEHREQRL